MTNNNQTTNGTDVVPVGYKLLTEGDLDWRLSAEQFDELSGMVLERVAEENLDSEYGITLGDTIDILVKAGVPRAYAETQAHDYIKGRAFQLEEPQTLSEIVSSKASSLERRLLRISERINTLNYKAEEEIPLVEDRGVKGNVRFATQANTGNTRDMNIDVYGSKRGRAAHYFFSINVGKGVVEAPEKLKTRFNWTLGWKLATMFPPSYFILSLSSILTRVLGNEIDKRECRDWQHDTYALPFKYLAYIIKKGFNKATERFRDPRVTVNYGGKRLSLEKFLGGVVGRTDRDGYYDKMIRFAVKNLVPALERDLTQAQDYANGLEI